MVISWKPEVHIASAAQREPSHAQPVFFYDHDRATWKDLSHLLKRNVEPFNHMRRPAYCANETARQSRSFEPIKPRSRRSRDRTSAGFASRRPLCERYPNPAFAGGFHRVNVWRHGVVRATIPPLAWPRPCLREIASAPAISL